jgi:hypothetical protein
MLETTLDEILTSDPIAKKIFLGTFARDELPIQPPFPSCLIFNTAPRSNSGEHWLALHYDENGVCVFFDPYGMPANHFGMASYLQKTSNIWRENKKRLQGLSQYCGYYCFLFLLFKARSKTIQFFQSFTTSLSKNDKIIKDLFEI